MGKNNPKAIGIVAEYNPFHNGHRYQIDSIRKDAEDIPVVAVMSGNFIQRGEPAIADKYARTEMALLGGVDLVIELPTIFSVGGAEPFAAGAVSLIKKLGIEKISFGSESADLEGLWDYAKILAKEPAEFKEELKKQLDEGFSYAKSRYLACNRCTGKNPDEKQGSNDILAIEYLKQIILQDAKIEPSCVKRAGGSHTENTLPNEENFASASAIRDYLLLQKKEANDAEISRFMPQTTIDVFGRINNDIKPILNDIYDLIRIKILTGRDNELEEILGAGEGLTNKMRREARCANTVNELTEKVISKRYAKGRIQRLYLQILLGLKKDEYKKLEKAFVYGNSGYARVLGFNEKGAALIKSIKKENKAMIPIITNINKEAEMLDDIAKRVLEYDILAMDLYNMAIRRPLYEYSDFVRRPVKK